jgi:A/G-specific adenine glycosylase
MEFSKAIWSFYEKNKRSFPWRDTTDPYAILVSEIMLQQTQTHRVLPKYVNWLQTFPTIQTLATATLFDVLQAWSGLGYNRRAKYLLEAAKVLAAKSDFPTTYKELVALPGIGEYTANAVLAFAFNQPTVVLETNIRTAIIHHFFVDDDKITDKQIKEKLQSLIESEKDPRNWYYALMDYGSWLKSEGIDYFHKQKNYSKQKAFKGSERFVRGWILKQLTLTNQPITLKSIRLVGYTKKQVTKITNDMVNEKLLRKVGNAICIPND